MTITVQLPNLIDLRYYRGWMIRLNTQTETFECAILGLFGFLTSRDLQKAIDASGRAV